MRCSVVLPRTERCRPRSWNGIHRIVLPAIGHKYFETVSPRLPLRARRDPPRLRRRPRLQRRERVRPAAPARGAHPRGDQRRRHRAQAPQVERPRPRRLRDRRSVLGQRSRIASIADAEVIADYYREQLRDRAGRDPVRRRVSRTKKTPTCSRGSDSKPRDYILYVSRFEPENNPLEVVRAYEKRMRDRDGRIQPPGHARQAACTPTTWCAEAAPPRAATAILFPGALYGRDYRTLQRNALALHPGHGGGRDASRR